MPTPELTYLRKLLGNAWVDAEVLTDKPTHRLGLWQKKDPNNVWVKYTEELVKGLLTGKNIKANPEVLAHKLKSKTGFVSTLAEMESTVFLAEQGFKVTLEPTAPKKGPDLRADWEDVPYFVEIRTVGFSEGEDRRNSVTNEIFAKLETVPSSYQVMLTVGEEYKRGSPKLRGAVKAVLDSLNALKERGAKEATLYCADEKEALLLLPGVSLSEKYSDIRQRAGFVARFEHLGKELSGTPASFFQPLKHPPERVKDHERLRKILGNKRGQIPKASRGVIVLEVSELFMLSEFSIKGALYGDLRVDFLPVKGPEEAVGDAITSRNNRGFFGKTSRVSAVVIQKRKVEDGQVKNEWRVYPTNRANHDTISLSLAELERFGNLEDRKHLSRVDAT
jgi:hypothetical protein